MADQTKLRKRLETLLKRSDNQKCADCGRRGPRWASANLGTFFCIECSGIHRNLGVHISFVRSVNLDTWTVKQVEYMEEWGNARANAYYEARMPNDYIRPTENDSVRVVEKFIRDKYQHKKFIADTIPAQGTYDRPEAAVTHKPAQAAPPRKAQAVEKTATVSVPQPVVAKAETNLLDFFDEPSPPAQPVTQPQQQQQQQQSFGDPFSSSGFTQEPERVTHNPAPQADPFFSQAPPVQVSQVAPVQKPVASNDAIMSLFNSGNNGGNVPQQGHAMQGGAGSAFGISTMPPPHPHMGGHGMMPPAAPMMGYNAMGQPPHGGMMQYGGGMYPPQGYQGQQPYPRGPGMGHQQGHPMQQQPHGQQQGFGAMNQSGGSGFGMHGSMGHPSNAGFGGFNGMPPNQRF